MSDESPKRDRRSRRVRRVDEGGGGWRRGGPRGVARRGVMMRGGIDRREEGWVEARFERANSTRRNGAEPRRGSAGIANIEQEILNPPRLRRRVLPTVAPSVFSLGDSFVLCRAPRSSWVCSGPCPRWGATISGGRCPARRDSATPKAPRARYARSQIRPSRPNQQRGNDVDFVTPEPPSTPPRARRLTALDRPHAVAAHPRGAPRADDRSARVAGPRGGTREATKQERRRRGGGTR